MSKLFIGWLQQIEGFQSFHIFIHRIKTIILCIFTKQQTSLTTKFISEKA